MKSFYLEHPAGDIWLLGGAELVKSFAKLKLIDECIITVIPTNLQVGIKLEISVPARSISTDLFEKFLQIINFFRVKHATTNY